MNLGSQSAIKRTHLWSGDDNNRLSALDTTTITTPTILVGMGQLVVVDKFQFATKMFQLNGRFLFAVLWDKTERFVIILEVAKTV